MRALKKIMAALALTAVLAGCSADNILSSIQGGKADTVQKVSRPAVESAELQFTHPAAGDTIAVFDYTAENERIDAVVDHITKYMSLRNMSNKEKRVAICYFKTPGKDALLASGMEVIPSLYNFLKRLRSEGYDVGGLPATVEEFGKRIHRDGAVMGSYAKGAQEQFLKTAHPVWLSTEQYEQWAHEVLLPEKYQEVTDRYGDAPGNLLATEDSIAIACLQFGNILLFPQPRPALGDDEFKLVHGMPVAPPHSYLAPYLYMQKGFKADAVIHFGTHGNLEYTPGKNVAQSQADWSDVLIGNLPHFYFYTTGNVGEGIIAKRRTHAVLVTHLTPPYVESGMRQRYSALLEDIHKVLDEGTAKHPYPPASGTLCRRDGRPNGR